MPSIVNANKGRIGSSIMRQGCLVGLATVGHHSWEFTRDLLQEARPLNYFYTHLWIPGREISEAYNIIFDYALEGDYEFLLLKEEDTISPADTWVKFLNKMRYNPDISVITGVYPRKFGGDPTPFFYRGNGRGSYLDWKWGEFFEVTGVPFGCTLIRVADLHKMDEYVNEIYVPNWPERGKGKWVKAYCQMNVPMLTEDGVIELTSQDLYFSEVARKAGLHLFVDASVKCYHLDIKTGIKYTVPVHLHDPAWKKEEGKRAVNLGCGSEWNLVHGLEPTRVDFREEVEPDLRMDLRDLSGIENESFDYVYSSHTLEHFIPEESDAIMKEMVRICKPGGELHIVVPDIEGAIELMRQGVEEPAILWHVYGAQDADWNMHHTGFTSTTMGKKLTQLGLKGYIMKNGLSLIIRAFKPPLPEWYDEWMKLDKTGWEKDRFFNYELEGPKERTVRLNTLRLPIDESVPDENIEAFFTPSKRTYDERKGIDSSSVQDDDKPVSGEPGEGTDKSPDVE